MKRLLPGIIIAAAVFILQIVALPKAGMTWDEPSVFLIGRSNLKFWTSFDRRYLNQLRNETLWQDNPMYYMYGAEHYPPFSYVISSAASAVLSETLGIMGVVDAHHVGGLVLASAGVAALYGIALAIGLSPAIAGVTTLLYATYPTIVGQMRNDAKDVPLMSMAVIFMYVFIRFARSWETGTDARRILWAAASGIVLGWAAAIKPTAFLLFGVVVVWVLFAAQDSRAFYRSVKPVRRMLLLLPFIGALSVIAFVAAWPWLWENPMGRLLQAWGFFKTVGYHMPVPYFGKLYRAGISVPLHYPLGILLVQTPILLTVFALIGTASAVRAGRNRDNALPLLAVFWFVIPLARFWFDGVIIYAKIRQFIEVMPAFFLLVGLGISVVASRATQLLTVARVLRHRMAYTVMMGAIAAVTVGHHAWISYTYFPYEPAYFNFIVGGTKGVSDNKLFDVEYWGSGTAEAMRWIREKEAGQPADVYACLMQHLAVNYEGENVNAVGLGLPSKYTILPNSPSWFDGALVFYAQNQKLVHTIERAGAPLFYIYEHTSPLIWRCGWESHMTTKFGERHPKEGQVNPNY